LQRVANSDRFFWSGLGKLKSAVADWQRSLAKLFKLAGVKGHAHQFRDTFSVGLLTRGVPLEDVAMALGHSSIRVTEKHYAPWIAVRQKRLEELIKQTW
jgi:integrase